MTTDIQNEIIPVVKGMEAYGGSFVQALANAISYADMTNAGRIKEAFPEYWEKYLKIGEDLL